MNVANPIEVALFERSKARGAGWVFSPVDLVNLDQLGKLTIALKQTSPRIMATAGTISGSIIQALRHLGKNHVTEETVKRLDRRLSPDDRKQLLKDLAYSPAWIALILRKLATLG